MDAFAVFRRKLGDRLNREVFSSPHTYRLAKTLFLKRTRFPFEASRQMAALALDLTAAAYRRRAPVVWTTAFFPTELIHALGCVPFAPETAAATAASLDLAPRLLEAAAREGFSTDGCSFHRCAAGGALLEYFPIPDCLAASSHLCDGAPQLFRYLARRLDRPLCLLDVPARPGPDAERYVARQLKHIARRLEAATGQRLDPENLRRAIDLSNQARAAMQAANAARRRVPAPMQGREALDYVYLQFVGLGHEKTPEVYRTLSRELAAKTVAPDRERFRLVWLQLRPYYRTEFLPHLEDHLRARIVCEEMNHVYWPSLDPERPFLSLARKVLSHPSLGPLERRAQWVRQAVTDYQAHGVIHFSHWGCRQAVGALPHLQATLRREGIPFLSLDGDCVDRGGFFESQARTRIEAFIELLENRSI